ncbi:MAG TPA: hypothetical protein PLY47_07360 [Rhodoglobus sp.]|nr:hypothetical protein [Rhodoglobus sp.]
MARSVDYTALTAPVTSEQVRTFRQQALRDPAYSSQFGVARVVVLVFVFVVIGFLFLGFAGVIVSMVASSAAQGLTITTAVSLLFPLLFIAAFAIIVVIAVRGALGGGGRWERWYRLTTFAAANGLIFSPVDADPTYPGAIFISGRSRVALDHLRTPAGRFFDYGNYRYVTGSGKNSTTHNWGFVALSLDRALPHMVLDSRSNNGLFGGTNLPTVFSKDQVLSLEGDFDRHFILYCPRQYERDALYVFTPDLMALLIDEAAPFDVEIVDSWMFVYSATVFDLRNPAAHQRILRIVDTVGAKTLSRTDLYADERVGSPAANIVAPEGRRLRRGVSVVAVITVIVFGAIWAWSFLADALGI